MIRVTTILLFMILGVSAAARYQAEFAVREARAELQRLELVKEEEQRAIQMLRAEVAYLENPERLAKLAVAKTGLRPSARHQVLNAREFAVAMGVVEAPADYEDIAPPETIANAIAMAQVANGD